LAYSLWAKLRDAHLSKEEWRTFARKGLPPIGNQ